jgi:LETM1 and EF-hand domain-containing protein 1
MCNTKREPYQPRYESKAWLACVQDTVSEMAKNMKSNKTGETQASAAELYAFMKQVRAGQPVSQYEIVKFAQLFNDELTLDNLERIHLVNLCRFVGIQPFGTDAFLVHTAVFKCQGLRFRVCI